jgi:hypothetical protein
MTAKTPLSQRGFCLTDFSAQVSAMRVQKQRGRELPPSKAGRDNVAVRQCGAPLPVTAMPMTVPVMATPAPVTPVPAVPSPMPVMTPPHFLRLQLFHLGLGGDRGTGILIRRRQPSILHERLRRQRRGLRSAGDGGGARGYANGKFKKVATFHDIHLFVDVA